MCIVATDEDDVDGQRKGILIILWFDPNRTLCTVSSQKFNTRSLTLNSVLPARIAAIHLCTPDTPIFRFRRAVITATISRFARCRMQMHIGTLLVHASWSVVRLILVYLLYSLSNS